MIQNDEEKEWMLPLLELRNELDPPKTSDADRPLRDFRRMNGAVQLFNDRPIPGPYKQTAREDWLRKVLLAQQHIREHGPEEVQDIEGIDNKRAFAASRRALVHRQQVLIVVAPGIGNLHEEHPDIVVGPVLDGSVNERVREASHSKNSKRFAVSG